MAGDYVVVALLGALVGAVEIISRYRDEPWNSLRGAAAVGYVTVNAAAACVALLALRTYDVTLGAQNPNQLRLLQASVAGLAATAFLRASFLVVRVGGRDVAAGPAALLQVLLFATDRDVDRRRAVLRAERVTEALEGLDYDEISEALPTYCLVLMQNVSRDERDHLLQEVDVIRRSNVDEVTKVNAIGLALMGVVGRKVLVAAADALRSRSIRGGVLGDVFPYIKRICRQEKEAA